jgi:hypothetical protein
MDGRWYNVQAWNADGPGPYASKQALEADERRLLPSDGQSSPVHALLTNGGSAAREYAKGGFSERIQTGQASWLGVSDAAFVDILDDTAKLQTQLPLGAPAFAAANELIAVPIGTHRVNTLFVNVSRLCQFNQKQTAATPDSAPYLAAVCSLATSSTDGATLTRAVAQHPAFSDLKNFLDLLARLRAAGTQEILSLPQAQNNAWVLTALTFENVMPAHVPDAAAFREIWSLLQAVDPASLERIEGLLRETVAETLELAKYASIPEFEAEEGPNAGVHSVAMGTSTFSVMGDWVARDVEDWARDASSQGNENHVVRIPFPGTAGKLVYTSDALILPRDALGRGINPARDLISAAISPQGQAKLAATKRSLTILRDLRESGSDTEVSVENIPGLIHVIERGSFANLERRTAALFSGSDAQRLEAASNLVQWIVTTRAQNRRGAGSSDGLF